MSKFTAIDLHNFNNRAEQAKDRNRQFLANLESAQIEKGLPVDLTISGATISITWLGETAAAAPRIVMTPDSKFVIEYCFKVHRDDEQVSLWAFYLADNGKIALSADGQGSFPDFNSEKCRSEICRFNLSAMLDSEVFSPSTVGSG